MRRFVWFALAMFLLSLCVGTPRVFAQGTTGSINGTVSDNTSSVLPGVTVTATSPALMGAQTAVTNDQGQYRFPALPPGSYRLEFQLAGFNTIVRQDIVVSVGFAAGINVQLQLATLNETVTVTGASPVVDTQSTTIQTNFTQDMIRSLPNARDIWALIAVAPGTSMNSFDVGGSRAGTQTGYSAYGTSGQVRVQVDGANATEDTGGTGYFNYGAFEEVQIGTDSNDASMPTPGVQINAVVKSGGNQFRGDLYTDFQHSSMQAKNATDEIKRQGLGEGTRITKYYDPNIGIGGPIKRDRIWYFVSARDQYSGTNVGGFPVDAPGTFEFKSYVQGLTEKTTYQLTQNNKISQFMELRRKLQPNRGASSTAYQDATYKQESISTYGSVEWSSVVSPAFFMNTRFSSWGYNWPNYAYGSSGVLGEELQPRRTEELTDNVSGGAREDKLHRRRWQFDWTGTLFRDELMGANHTLKFGFTGETEREKDLDNGFVGEYTAQFDSRAEDGDDFFRPWRAQIANTPRLSVNNIEHYGAYVQNQMVFTRNITVNAGLRWDYYHVFFPDQGILEGRFSDYFFAGAPLPNGHTRPASFPGFVIPGNDNVLTFPRGFAPRFGIAYDIAGDGKTVVKANWGIYQSNPGPQNFVNPNQSQTATFEWLDCRNAAGTPVGCGDGQFGDRQFTLNELGTFVSSTGGSFNTIDPDLNQEYSTDFSVFVERELIANLGIRTGYVRKQGHNNWQEVQVGRPYEGYTDARTFTDSGPDGVQGNGDDGPPIIAFDYPAGVTIPASRTDLRNQPLEKSWDQNIDITLNKRMSNRWSLLASFLYNWDHQEDAPQNPNQERFKVSDLTNWAFKFFGTYQAPWQITINPVLRYQKGENLARIRQITLRTGTLNYEAEAPGTYVSDNVAVFDLAAERRFRLPGNRSVDLFVAAFNALNSNAATSQDDTIGRRNATLDGEVINYQRFLRAEAILPPRVFRIGVKLAF